MEHLSLESLIQKLLDAEYVLGKLSQMSVLADSFQKIAGEMFSHHKDTEANFYRGLAVTLREQEKAMRAEFEKKEKIAKQSGWDELERRYPKIQEEQ